MPARYWTSLGDSRVQCHLCPRECSLKPGQRGFCFVRQNIDGQLELTTHGRSSGFCIDPIEKKPLNHFHPGTSVLSFGQMGCNLSCKYCQNWDISKSSNADRSLHNATGDDIAEAAARYGCSSVAYTYNDPVIFAEYAIEVAEAVHQRGLLNVAVTAGYINPEARKDFFAPMDAANVDLKGFTDAFYTKLTGGRLQPVLDTLRYLVHETDVWVEITTLLIPGHNDGTDVLTDQCRWIASELGPDVPVHFTAFHPDFKMMDAPPTPPRTLVRARSIAIDAGLHFVYTGNARTANGSTTFCPQCQTALIERDGYTIDSYLLTPDGHCSTCGRAIPGRWGEQAGTFGNHRIPIRVGR